MLFIQTFSAPGPNICLRRTIIRVFFPELEGSGGGRRGEERGGAEVGINEGVETEVGTDEVEAAAGKDNLFVGEVEVEEERGQAVTSFRVGSVLEEGVGVVLGDSKTKQGWRPIREATWTSSSRA